MRRTYFFYEQRLKGAFEFHISRAARATYEFDEAIFTLNGNVILADFGAAREFAQKMNAERDLVRHPEQAVRASEINAMGLIDEILHMLVGLYREHINPKAIAEALDWLDGHLGENKVDFALLEFADQFPAFKVYKNEMGVEVYYRGETDGVPNREIVLEEILLLWLANMNPAFGPYQELFDDELLQKQTAYLGLIEGLKVFFETQPPFGSENFTLINLLRAPALTHPDSLENQLAYIRRNWGVFLGDFLTRLLRSLDLIKEEEKMAFWGPGPIEPYDYFEAGEWDEPERFSEDKDWMSRLVLMAKNTYVWLGQLSKEYDRPIERLDQIPDEELMRLARSGINGLWFIGLWERSEASRKIKQWMGNEDAISSAYSLYDYQIAHELGGEAALQNLRERAWRYGIRLASDMVPNHMGIDSRWVAEHPDWFLSLDHSPFPGYSFSGVDLLEGDERVGVYLEDHYFDKTDAAVVFKRVDNYSGEERYIYHGNDGTNMPWNDTAQLNFLKPEVREAVIQTILHVARQFPIIRFDAAMTLAKKHIQRLWFPEPGSGGAIPSRAEYGLSRPQFDLMVPNEFWREVVDRVAEEVPDTLLLAEAFWMMEGYFVRTLGMHRVYNSAFMHMLRDEDNANYRLVIKNTVEFNPQILKRYVNFMNNPDEETAVEQFGKGDKYFGVCTLMSTLPGLPMFGHGQIEGYSEKYGMEYKQAKWDEQVDEELVGRHEREIFPLLHRRKLFSEVENFLLYDFYTGDGVVNEDVFAYSNRLGEERALILYHNRYGDTRGWIKTSAAYSTATDGNGEREMVQRSLGEGLGLPTDEGAYVIFREHLTGLEYLRSCKEIHEQGMFAEIYAYGLNVFLDFSVVYASADWPYGEAARQLGGQGVPSVQEIMLEMALAPVLTPYRELVNQGMLDYLIDNHVEDEGEQVDENLLKQVEEKGKTFLGAAGDHSGKKGDIEAGAASMRAASEAMLNLPVDLEKYCFAEMAELAVEDSVLGDGVFRWYLLWGWVLTRDVGRIGGGKRATRMALTLFDEWKLGKVFWRVLAQKGYEEELADYGVELMRVILDQESWFLDEKRRLKEALDVAQEWFGHPGVQQIVGVNRHEDILWFNQELLERWLWWMMAAGLVQVRGIDGVGAEELMAVFKKLWEGIEGSDYQVEKYLAFLEA